MNSHFSYLFLHYSLIISMVLLSSAIIITFLRLLKGPNLPDRVIAFDAISMMIICVISIFSVVEQQPLYLDIIIALALISFLGTIAFAQFIEWQLGQKNNSK
ncbi:MAG: cation:proton antiporter [Pseudomonadota bacterium]